MTRPRRWTLGPLRGVEDLERVLERLVDLTLLDAEALLSSEPELAGVLAVDMDDALAAADAAVARLLAQVAAVPAGEGGRARRAEWLALASRVQRCAAGLQARRDGLEAAPS